MNRKHLVPLLLLAIANLLGCSERDNSEAKPIVATPVTAPAQQCFQNTYPFPDNPAQQDVLLLTLETNGSEASGAYNWLPAMKDRRIGHFEGTIQGESIGAVYQFDQEGNRYVAGISLRLESDQVVVHALDPQLGLDAIIARVDCDSVSDQSTARRN